MGAERRATPRPSRPRRGAPIVHELRGGFCIVCGETLEWLEMTDGKWIEAGAGEEADGGTPA